MTKPKAGNGQNGTDNKTKPKGPSDDNTQCTQCKETICYATIVTGSGQNKREKKQKAKFEWISCDICNRWFHGTCQGLQPEEVISVVNLANSGVRWFCSDCVPGLTTNTDHANLKKLNNIEQMIASLDQKSRNISSQSN